MTAERWDEVERTFRLPGPDGACEPLAPVRFAAAFEEA